MTTDVSVAKHIIEISEEEASLRGDHRIGVSVARIGSAESAFAELPSVAVRPLVELSAVVWPLVSLKRHKPIVFELAVNGAVGGVKLDVYKAILLIRTSSSLPAKYSPLKLPGLPNDSGLLLSVGAGVPV